jgi:hypothetical protein
VQGIAQIVAIAERRQQAVDRRRISAATLHGPVIQIEMAGVAPLAVLVGLFAQHDFVNQSRYLGMGRRQPGNVDTAQVMLERLEQRHEIPHREDMVLHKDSQRSQVVQSRIERMFEQGATQRHELLLQMINSGGGGHEEN